MTLDFQGWVKKLYQFNLVIKKHYKSYPSIQKIVIGRIKKEIDSIFTPILSDMKDITLNSVNYEIFGTSMRVPKVS